MHRLSAPTSSPSPWGRIAAAGRLTLLLLTLGSQAAWAETTPPMPLRTPALLTPFETAGTGLAPEVSVRLVVGVDGRASQVEVLSVRPSTDFDAVVARSTIEQLEAWRYLPAQEDGQTVATTLQFSIQLRPVLRGSMKTTGHESAADLLASDPASRRSSLFVLPEAMRRQLLAQQIEVATSHLSQGRIQQHETARFLVFTDSGDPAVAESVANSFEATFDALDTILGTGIEPQPEELKVVVLLYDYTESLNRLRQALQLGGAGRGFYLNTGLVAFSREAADSQSLLGLMLHEATHAYVDRYLTRPGLQLPSWISEGLAEYVGSSQIKKGTLIPGKVLQRRFVAGHLPGSGASRVRTVAGTRVRDAKKAQREESMGLEELLDARRDIFYGPRRGVYYATGWLLVHFLRHGEPGWAEERFPDLVLYAVEGYPLREAIETVYGRSVAELEAPFRDYIRKL